MNIALLGGSFNPIHNGHLFLAQEVLRQTEIEQVWFVVSPHNPFKTSTELIDENIRLALVRQTLAEYKDLIVCDKEYHLPRPSYMSQTLAALHDDHPNDTFTLLIGADNWDSFPQWHDSSTIINNYNIYIYPRKGYAIDPLHLPANVTYLPLPMRDISATAIRQQLFSGIIPYDMLPTNVINTLQQHNFYNPQT